jgi:hypothetical protein
MSSEEIAITQQLIFNQKLVLGISIFFLLVLWVVLIDGTRKVYINLKKR